jgi:hypothetical protein
MHIWLNVLFDILFEQLYQPKIIWIQRLAIPTASVKSREASLILVA